MQASAFDEVMAGLGPLDDSIMSVVRATDTQWVVMADNIEVFVDLDTEGGRVRLSTELGAPLLAHRAGLYEHMLIYNMAGQETGDVVMGLSGPGGTLVQIVSLPTAGLTAQTLISPLVNVAVRTPIWRAIVSRGTDDVAADRQPDLDPAIETFIRV